MYFEEGTGKRDTIYLAYDTNSVEMGIPSVDTIYGMKWTKLDTTKFQASFGYSPHFDSIDRAVVGKIYTLTNGVEVSFSNGVLPLKVKWDVSLLRSDSLRCFPNQKPFPRAQVEWEWGNGTVYMKDPNCNISWPVLITDSAQYLCVRRDSMMFYDVFNNPKAIIANMGIQLKPWIGTVLSVAEVQEDNKVNIYPNPVQDKIIIELSAVSRYIISLCNMLGQQVMKTEFTATKTELDVSELPKGVYFVQVSNDQFKEVKKIIIQ